MNAERRKKLDDAAQKLQLALDLIREVLEDEQSAYDNMPEGLQQSDRGSAMSDGLSSLESAADGVENAIGEVESARDQ